MLKVWGRNTSGNVQKVMWAIGELGLACERIDIGGPFGKNNEPEYLALNPNGLVPTLEEDDGFVLWESNAIVRYLAAKHGTLEPADLRERAQASKWMDWQISVLGPAIVPLFWGLVRTPPEQRDHAAIAAGRKRSEEALLLLDRELAKTRFLAGDDFSMGDIPVAVFAYRYLRLVSDGPPMPNLARWYDEIRQRPAFDAHVLQAPFA